MPTSRSNAWRGRRRHWWHRARLATMTGMDASHPAGPPPALQPDPLLYPEVAAVNGSWAEALRRAAADMHVDLGTVRGPASGTGSRRVVDASVHASRGSLVVTLGQQERAFDIRMWWTGVGEAARGRTTELQTVVDIAHAWQVGTSVAELRTRWPFLKIDELTLAHERGEAVAFKWQLVRNAPDRLIDHDLVEAAYANPLLRSLFPLISHGTLQFSRCTHSPWSYDVPTPVRLLGGGWKARPPPKVETFRIASLKPRRRPSCSWSRDFPTTAVRQWKAPRVCFSNRETAPCPDRSPTPQPSLRRALMETR